MEIYNYQHPFDQLGKHWAAAVLCPRELRIEYQDSLGGVDLQVMVRTVMPYANPDFTQCQAAPPAAALKLAIAIAPEPGTAATAELELAQSRPATAAAAHGAMNCIGICHRYVGLSHALRIGRGQHDRARE